MSILSQNVFAENEVLDKKDITVSTINATIQIEEDRLKSLAFNKKRCTNAIILQNKCELQ